MTRAFGARVFATAGSDDKCAACERLGAEHAVNYKVQDFSAALTAITEGRGIDVILDMVGAPYFSRNVDLLALDGRLVQIAVLHGAKAEINLVRLCDCCGSRARGMAAGGDWERSSGGLRDVSARTGCRSPSFDGIRQPHRQDPAYGLAAYVFENPLRVFITVNDPSVRADTLM
jgi:NADPH:quinone reductase-like Zn-dependent oxidoreductase